MKETATQSTGASTPRGAAPYATDEHEVVVQSLQTYTTKHGEEWHRVIATDGGQIEFLMTNLHLGRIALGDKLRVTVAVIEEA